MIVINNNQGIPTRLVMETAKICLMILWIIVEITKNAINYEINKKYEYVWSWLLDQSNKPNYVEKRIPKNHLKELIFTYLILLFNCDK